MAKWSVKQPHGVTRLALLLEGVVALAALLIGWLTGHFPSALYRLLEGGMRGAVLASLWGAAATLPLLGALALCQRYPVGPLRGLQDLVEQQLVPLFRGATWTDLAAVSLLAGIGEELFFRALLQDGLLRWLHGPQATWIALPVASVLFGLAHWISDTYALLATLVGLYLGALLLLSGHLLAPIVTHALYDFCALVYLVHHKGHKGQKS